MYPLLSDGVRMHRAGPIAESGTGRAREYRCGIDLAGLT